MPVVHLGVKRQLTQVAAQQGEVVLVVYPANLAQTVDGGFVVQMADQGIARIGGHGQHAALGEQCHGLFEQARLRVVRMDLKQLCHAETAALLDAVGEQFPHRCEVTGQPRQCA